MNTQEVAGLKKRERLRSLLEKIKVENYVQKDFEYVGSDEQLSEIITKMGQYDLHEIPVSNDGKELLGIVSYRTLLKRRNLPVETKANTLMVMPQEITLDSTVMDIAEAFVASGYRHIPVRKGQNIIGVVSRTDLINIVAGIKEFSDILVEDIMTGDVHTVLSEDSVEVALRSMRTHTLQTLPVIDKDGRLTGIVGVKQVANYNWRKKQRESSGEVSGQSEPVDMTVSSVALDSVHTIGPRAYIGTAIQEMVKYNISTLPVVSESGDLEGILSKYDIVELIASLKERDMVYTQIAGMDQEDKFALESMEREISASLQKIAKISKPTMFTMHVTKYHAQGVNFKYSLNGRMMVGDKTLVASAVDWDIVKATQDLMERFERMVIGQKEEKLDRRKKIRSIGHW